MIFIYVRKDSTDPERLVKQIMGYEQSDLVMFLPLNGDSRRSMLQGSNI